MKEAMIRTEKEALAFIEKHRLVTLFPVKNIAFPSLYGSTAGKSREEIFEKAWAWADNLAQQKKIYYGKLVGKQVTLVSLEVFPYIFKLYHMKEELNTTAKKILDYLTRHGATSTTRLRKQLNLIGKERKSQFTKAMDQLQLNHTITVVAREKSPKMTYTWDLIERWLPRELFKKSESTTETVAKERIVTKMLESRAISRLEEDSTPNYRVGTTRVRF